ncbi:Cytochrome P450 [Mycena venus]|uniref:Cytochrome P450 n=1 Tax=Mycena venus TaxID=2733690 RepID=A0A8H6YI44_9AGAR|nr:Cytochrome P450 [Mycena venus]
MSVNYYLLAFLTAWLTSGGVVKYLSLRSASKTFGSACPHAGVIWLHPFRVLTIVVAQWFPFKHQLGHYYAGFSFYLRHGSTCIGSVLLSGSHPTLWLADAHAMKTVTSEPGLFQKDMEAYKALDIYGKSGVYTRNENET